MNVTQILFFTKVGWPSGSPNFYRPLESIKMDILLWDEVGAFCIKIQTPTN